VSFRQACVTAWKRFAGVDSQFAARCHRRWAAAEARSLGRGGIAAVAEATGISDRTKQTGICEPQSSSQLEADRQRRPDGGRKRSKDKQPQLTTAL
jgi:hypothetical protein